MGTMMDLSETAQLEAEKAVFEDIKAHIKEYRLMTDSFFMDTLAFAKMEITAPNGTHLKTFDLTELLLEDGVAQIHFEDADRDINFLLNIGSSEIRDHTLDGDTPLWKNMTSSKTC
eukprot:sb/3476669/